MAGAQTRDRQPPRWVRSSAECEYSVPILCPDTDGTVTAGQLSPSQSDNQHGPTHLLSPRLLPRLRPLPLLDMQGGAGYLFTVPPPPLPPSFEMRDRAAISAPLPAPCFNGGGCLLTTTITTAPFRGVSPSPLSSHSPSAPTHTPPRPCLPCSHHPRPFHRKPRPRL
jgi:hypothetical protein